MAATTAVAPIAQGGAVAATPKKNDLQQWLKSDHFKAAVASALPKHLTAERFVRVALNALMRTPDLAKCTQESVFKCMLDLSASGLEADGRRAHLIPFKRNQKDGQGWKTTWECQLIIDYKGLVELAYRSGTISNIHADKVCDRDEFVYDRGLVLTHRINLREDRGAPYAYYARVVFKDGTETAEVMTIPEVNVIRARSKAGDKGPWVTDYDEMAKKTVFRRLSKWLTLSPEFRDAVDKDDDVIEIAPEPRKREVASISVESFAPSEEPNRGHDHTNDAMSAPAEPQEADPEEQPETEHDMDAVISDDYADQIKAEMDAIQMSPKDRTALWAQLKVQNVYGLTYAQAEIALAEIRRRAQK